MITGQEIVVRPEHVCEPEGVATLPMGLTFAENGDLLMAAGIANRDPGQNIASPRMVMRDCKLYAFQFPKEST